MNHSEIKKYLDDFNNKRERTIAIVDFGNVEKWRNSLGWIVGIKELGKFVKHFSLGKKFLRRFYYECDLDVEMTVDLIRERDNYDIIILFSGDGDLMYAIKYLKENFDKYCIVFGARGHIGREVFDAKNNGIIKDILFAEDFEYRLNKDRFRS